MKIYKYVVLSDHPFYPILGYNDIDKACQDADNCPNGTAYDQFGNVVS